VSSPKHRNSAPSRSRRAAKKSAHSKGKAKREERQAHAQLASPVVTTGSTSVPLLSSVVSKVAGGAQDAWNGWMKGISASMGAEHSSDAPYASIREFQSKLGELSALDKDLKNLSPTSSDYQKKKKRYRALEKGLENESFGGRPIVEEQPNPSLHQLPAEVQFINDEIQRAASKGEWQTREKAQNHGLRLWYEDQILSSQNHLHGLVHRWAQLKQEGHPSSKALQQLKIEMAEELQHLNGLNNRYYGFVSQLTEKLLLPNSDFEKLNALIRLLTRSSDA
jgi:hypothetical protein